MVQLSKVQVDSLQNRIDKGKFFIYKKGLIMNKLNTSILLVCLILTACFPSDSDKIEERQKALETLNKPVKVIIGERVLNIPKKYINGVGLKQWEKKDSVFMTLAYPDFTSLQDYISREEYESARLDHQHGGLLLEEASVRASIEQMINNRLRYSDPTEPEKREYGLRSFNTYYDSPEGKYLYSTLHVQESQSGEYLSFIECSTFKRGAKFPTCSHRFVDNSILYKIHYNKKKYFPKWKEMQQKTIGFIDGFELNLQQENKGK